MEIFPCWPTHRLLHLKINCDILVYDLDIVWLFIHFPINKH